MKKVILFRPGASGHFLAEFISSSNTNIATAANFRVDMGPMVKSSVFAENLSIVKTLINTDPRETILSHYMNISDLSEFYQTHWIRKIYPETNIFGLIKNIFYKKQQVENIDWSHAGTVLQFDGYFENLKNWYFLIKQDTDLPSDYLLDFGKLQDIDFLIDVYKQLYNQHPDQKKIDFAQAYISKQDRPLDDIDSLDLEEIIQHVNPMSLLDVAIILFLYEKNHQTIDQNRLWTIDDLPDNLDSALNFLIKNKKSYTIF